MLLAGDELGRTQLGNNNAYPQDNEVSWIDWVATDQALLAFTRRMLAIRRSRPELRGDDWLTDADVAWLRRRRRRRSTGEDWTDGDPALVMAYEDVVVALNPGAEDRTLAVPDGAGWAVVLDTTTLGRRAGRRRRRPTSAARPSRSRPAASSSSPADPRPLGVSA